MNITRKKYEVILNDGVKYFIDPDTGEAILPTGESLYVQTEEEKRKVKEFFSKKARSEFVRQQINEQYKDYGSFVWNVYSINQKSFPQLKASNITRLMFLSTYVTYDGYLMYGKKMNMNKANMFELLGLSDREYRAFYKDMIDNSILYEKDDKIFINAEMFGKGKLSKKYITKFASQEKYITRLYIDGVRSLYKKSTPRSHKTLSYLFQVLPYVNRQYNIVCFNPLEECLEDIQGMSLGQFCEIIGYSSHNSGQLFKYLFEPQFIIDGQVKTAMRYVVDKSLAKETYSMYINPRVYYAGNSWKQVEVLGKF